MPGPSGAASRRSTLPKSSSPRPFSLTPSAPTPLRTWPRLSSPKNATLELEQGRGGVAALEQIGAGMPGPSGAASRRSTHPKCSSPRPSPLTPFAPAPLLAWPDLSSPKGLSSEVMTGRGGVAALEQIGAGMPGSSGGAFRRSAHHKCSSPCPLPPASCAPPPLLTWRDLDRTSALVTCGWGRARCCSRALLLY